MNRTSTREARPRTGPRTQTTKDLKGMHFLSETARMPESDTERRTRHQDYHIVCISSYRSEAQATMLFVLEPTREFAAVLFLELAEVLAVGFHFSNLINSRK